VRRAMFAGLSSRPLTSRRAWRIGWRLGRSGNGLKVVLLAGEFIRPLPLWSFGALALLSQSEDGESCPIGRLAGCLQEARG
jgi:hypothetical protein